LTAAGITPQELTELAALYPPGTTLWRTRIPHFTQPWDENWGISPPADASGPTGGDPQCSGCSPPQCEPKASHASEVGCLSQVYSERIGLAGSAMFLTYSSGRVPGRVGN